MQLWADNRSRSNISAAKISPQYFQGDIMCNECNTIDTGALYCERCCELASCSEIRLPSRKVSLCRECMKAIEKTVLGIIDTYDPEASTIYVQLGCDEVRRLRDEAAFGMIPPTIRLTFDQQEYIYNLLFNPEISDWDLGLVNDP